MNIPLVDLSAQAAEIAAEVEPKLLAAFRSGGYIGGSHVAGFEAAYSEFVGVGHTIGVGNGTDAVELALRAVGVGPGDEVIMPANTFIATAEAASRIGAVPVPVDVDPQYLLLDPEKVAAAITARTKAVVPVHLYGQVAPVDEVAAAAPGLPIVEDAAQSQGAERGGRRAGALADIAATSFYPGKNLGASGDGGAVTTDDDDLAATVRLLANHGSRVRYEHVLVGMNSRLDALHAITLTAKLARLEAWNERRRELAANYSRLLADVPGLRLPASRPGNQDVWHLYVVRAERRDALLARLNEAGIGAGLHYLVPWHLSQAYAHLGHRPGTAPVAEAAAGEILSLPLYPHLRDEDLERVVAVVTRALADA